MENTNVTPEILSPTYTSPATNRGLQPRAPEVLTVHPQSQLHPPHDDSDRTATMLPPNASSHMVNVDAPAKIEPIAAAPRVTPLEQLGAEPRLIDCPFCQYRSMTKVTEEASSSTNMAALACCLIGGICCVCIPYLCKMCSDYHHSCTNCNRMVAIKPDSGPVQVQSRNTRHEAVSVMPPAPVKLEVAKPVCR